VGEADGDANGAAVGENDGTPVGLWDGLEEKLGSAEGINVGEAVPITGGLVGCGVGLLVGLEEILGPAEGCIDGEKLGVDVGVADFEGAKVGATEDDGTSAPRRNNN
jgi:hypothetical protein